MPMYVVLARWTGQGVANVRDTTKRYQEAEALFEKMGVRIHAFYWTAGRYDAVVIAEAPDDETASAATLAAASQGNIRTETLRAFSTQEMERILGKLP